jgi:hypothetical protein
MGSGASIDELSVQSISNGVKEIASVYKDYSSEENGIDGATLQQYENIDILLDELGIDKNLHRNRLKVEFEKLKQKFAAKSFDGSKLLNATKDNILIELYTELFHVVQILQLKTYITILYHTDNALKQHYPATYSLALKRQ